jgi:flagellar M-ring protein FliF
MRQFLADLLRQLKGIWSRLDGSQRLVVAAVMAAAVVGLVAMVWFAGRPSWQEVFSATSPEEMRDARRVLNQAGVVYQPDESGKSLLVEHSKYALAQQLLFEGGLRSASGTKSDGMSNLLADSDTRADLLESKARARAEDAIRQLEGVLAVTVTATRPRRSSFVIRDGETKARATVALRLRAGVAFEAVAKVAASQAASGVGVPEANVEVVNMATHARWHFDPDRDAGTGTGEFLAEERSMSESKTRDAQAALDAVYPGKTIVTVNVELAREWEVKTTKVLPTEPLVQSEKSTKDNTTNGTTSGGGDPSAAAGTGAEAANAALHKNTTSKETKDKQYVTDIGELRSGLRASPIKHISVAMLYDQSLEKVEGFQPTQLAGIVKSIVGWDSKRDDDTGFATMSSAFPAEAPALLPAGPGFSDLALRWAPTAAQVTGLVLVLLFLRSLFRRSGRARALAEPEPVIEVPEQELPVDEQARRMRREIERAIVQDPATLARMLESWITEQSA